MENIYQILKANVNLIYFLYGLAFFTLGFAILLKAKNNSKFRLADSLIYLAFFGILHGIYEWGYIFIPLQGQYLSITIIEFLYSARIFIEALSFAFLLYFGVHLLVKTKNVNKMWLFLSSFLFLSWILLSIYFKIKVGQLYFDFWLKSGDVWARYLLALPGSFIVCYALFLQKEDLKILNNKRIINNLYGLIIAIGLYGIVGGLVVPESSYLLADYINTVAFFTTFKLPVELFRIITGISMAYFIVGILEIHDAEYHYKLEKLKEERAVLNERQRIARNLHDGIIQSIYGVGLGLENVEFLIDEDLDIAKKELRNNLNNLNEIITDIRNYIIDLKPEVLEAGNLYQLLDSLLIDFDSISGKVNFDYRVSEEIKVFPEYLDNIYHILQEGLNNIKKHAQADNILLQVIGEDCELIIKLKDDGIGFKKDQIKDSCKKHQGLRNITERAKLLKGELNLNSIKGEGTEIIIKIPYEVIRGV